MEIVTVLFEYLILVLSISIHDCAQTWVAFRLGDPTARMLGRFTLNPMRHYDLWGTVIWPGIFLFRSPLVIGWGKDVPISTRNLRRPSLENAIRLAGPAAQLVTAVVCLVILVVWKHLSPTAAGCITVAPYFALRVPMASPDALPGIFPVVLLLYFGILISLFLFVFNLMPLPTLDGGKILRYYLPYRAAQLYDSWSLYITIGFLLIGFRLLYFAFSPVLGLFQGLLTTL